MSVAVTITVPPPGRADAERAVRELAALGVRAVLRIDYSVRPLSVRYLHRRRPL